MIKVGLLLNDLIKQKLFFFAITSCLYNNCYCQNTFIRVNLKHAGQNGSVSLYDPNAVYDTNVRGNLRSQLDSEGTTFLDIRIDKPRSVVLYCLADAQRSSFFSYHLYLSPGDDLTIEGDFKRKDHGILVTGKGAKNNQPSIDSVVDTELDGLDSDTVPARVLTLIYKEQTANRLIYADYIKKFHPSADFIKSYAYNVQYFAAAKYYKFKENIKFRNMAAYKRNYKAWLMAQQQLFKSIKLDNEEALNAINYLDLIRAFILREKEKYWFQSEEQPSLFYRNWYKAEPGFAKSVFLDERKNLFVGKVIDRFFNSRVNEFLYALLIKDNLYESDYDNIDLLFLHLKKINPSGRYIAGFDATIKAIVNKQHTTINSSMIFLPNDGTRLKSLKELLPVFKGKVVLVDMWGTWCGPCRDDINKNSAALHAYFKGKGLDFLYIANFDLDNPEKWRKLIGYFNLEGTHVLANKEFTADVMTNVQGTGYPTYFIIRKDGTLELSKTGYPLNKEIIINQLEAALKL